MALKDIYVLREYTTITGRKSVYPPAPPEPRPDSDVFHGIPKSQAGSNVKIHPDFAPWSEQELLQQPPEKVWHLRNVLRSQAQQAPNDRSVQTALRRVQIVYDTLMGKNTTPASPSYRDRAAGGKFQATNYATRILQVARQISNVQIRDQFETAVGQLKQRGATVDQWKKLLKLAQQEAM